MIKRLMASVLPEIPSRGLVGLLRSLAGTPASWRRSRRGSFLVIVVGTLALLAVVAVIYVTIGNQDARMKASLARHNKLERVINDPDGAGGGAANFDGGGFAQYVAGIISRDVLSTYYDTNTILSRPGGPPVLMREASDYPSTDWQRRSNQTGQNPDPDTHFDPVGGLGEFATTPGASLPVYWTPSDPWLASSEPTYLDYEGAGSPPLRSYLDARDWGHISNVAPDGRFINLYNLRNNFRAEGGVGSDSNGKPRLSQMLSLLDKQVNPVGLTDFGRPTDLNIPAHWDSRQRAAFRPARALPGDNVNDPDFSLYQWADADGDGMLDSRWFEMTDARDPDNIINLLGNDPKYRYFFATRIVDLSSAININTATDFRAVPSKEAPAGLTGADVDLRRLLTMQDVYSLYNPGNIPGILTGYAGIPNPSDASISATGDVPHNYGKTPLGATADGYDATRALRVGEYSELSLRLALVSGIVPSEVYRGDLLRTDFAVQHQLTPDQWDFRPVAGTDVASRRAEYYTDRTGSFLDARYDTAASDYTLIGGFGVSDLSELVTRWAVNDYSITSNLERALSGRDNQVPSSPATPGTPRYDPLRSTRPERDFGGFPIEMGTVYDGRYRVIDYTGTSDFSKTMLLFASDVRHRITPLSGARSFRNSRGVSPDVIDSGEVRLDATTIGAAAFYAGYADALLPFSGLTNAWDRANSEFTSLRTQFYGHQGPELAMYAAAHMAVNMADLKDGDSLPSSYTLLLNETYRDALDDEGQNVTDVALQLFPWWHDSGQLSLAASRLAPSTIDTVVPAVNVYGIEAQPFLTQVVTFTVYTDAPPSAGGDDEIGGIPPPTNPLITIDDSVTDANSDFLYRVVAFQLTNPFNKSVTLSDPNGPFEGAIDCDIGDPSYPAVDIEDSFFYITLGDKNGAVPVKHFKLVELVEKVYSTQAVADGVQSGEPGSGIGNDALAFGYFTSPQAGGADITLKPITIDAGQTIVCYTVSQVPRIILQNRYTPAIDPAMTGPDPTYFPNPTLPMGELRNTIHRMITQNIGGSSSDIGDSQIFWIPEFDPTPGASGGKLLHPNPTDDGTLKQFDPIITGTLPGDVVQLWRVLRAGNDRGGEKYIDPTQSALARPNTFWEGTSPQPPFQVNTDYLPRNLYNNDQLVDRMRIPSAANLNVRLHDALNNPQGEIAGTETDVADTSMQYTIAAWSMARRPADPRPGSMAPPKGAIPAYCLEAKYSTGWNFPSTAWSATLDEGDFASGLAKGAAKTVQSWRTNFITASLEPAESVSEATTHPINAMTNVLGPVGTVMYQENYPEVALAKEMFSTMRLADLLLPLGIGPTDAPLDASGTPVADQYLRYTTLGEALAVALGYEVVPAVVGDVTQLYMPAVIGSQPIKSPLDRGNLRLDDYVPFYDDNNDGVFTIGQDERRGLAIPLALNVLDIFSAKPGGPESRTRAVPGLININTMSTMVARQLPLLSPAPDMDVAGTNWWWWTAPLPGASSAYAPLGRLTPAVDIAASVISYRDKVNTLLKPSAVTDILTAGAFPNGDVWFRDVDASAAPIPPDQVDLISGRSFWTSIPGLNEHAGFRSIGELANVRFRNPSDPTDAAWLAIPVSIDHMGYDRETATLRPINNSLEGVDSVLYEVGGPPSGAATDELGNEYKEKLTVINAVANSVSTRSDYFAVWFVVHGYQKSDVENMKDEDPLVPSIARRFVMVVDRSGVVRKGDKARIVLFKEVPL